MKSRFYQKMIFFLILIGFLLIFDLFYPALSFEINQVLIQELFIRTLSSFCFHGNYKDFMLMIQITLSVLFLSSIILMIFDNLDYKNYILHILIIESMIHFFFWVFSKNPSSNPETPRFIVGDEFAIMTFYFLLGFVLEYILLYLTNLVLQKYKVEKKQEKMQETKYFCPYCNKIYYSNIEYCSNCKKAIPKRDQN